MLSLSCTALNPELLAVLRIVSRMDLMAPASISQTLGRTTNGDLMALGNLGYLREHAGRRLDGTADVLYSITDKGRKALDAQDLSQQSAPTHATGPTSPMVGALYEGAELRLSTSRAGAMDALRYPSRVGNRLYYRDGKTELAHSDSTDGSQEA